MIPLAYNYRNLIVRWRTTLMTAAGFTLVVTALIVMLAFVNGVRTVCVVSGQPENVIALRRGNSDEVLSQMDHALVAQVAASPGVRRGKDGRPMISRELFMVITQQDEQTGTYHFVQGRGVHPVALAVHSQVRMIEGEMFHRNRREVILGRSAARERGLGVGDELRMGDIRWRVVGIFAANGSAFESEAWCDLTQFADHFRRRGTCSSVVLRTDSPAAAGELAEHLDSHRAVPVEALVETDYYQQQAQQTNTIKTGALVIAMFMAIGAVFGVTNTMFAAIGERIKDIAVMRLLGFKRLEILISFLLEALLIATIGGTLGSLLGYAVNGLTLNTALGAKSIAFAFEVDSTILTIAACFTLVMGTLGGLLPAMSAMRVDPLEAMR